MFVISSLVIMCAVEDNEAIINELLAPDSRVEVVEQVPGKIGIVVETETTKDAQTFMTQLTRSPLVKDVSLIYHNFENEIDPQS